MAKIAAISASPSQPSSTDALVAHVAYALETLGHEVEMVHLREVSPEAMLTSRCEEPSLAAALAATLEADAVVLASPVFKASYSGLLKVFIDLLPMDAFAGKPVLPLLTGGSPAHVLALDYGLKPLAVTLGATHVADGRFVLSGDLDKYVDPRVGGATITDQAVAAAVHRTVDAFAAEVERAARVPVR